MSTNQPPSVFETRKETFLERPLPSSEESERTVLGALIVNNDLAPDVVGVLVPEDFYSPLTRVIYRAILELYDQARPLDPVLIADQINRTGDVKLVGGIASISSLIYGMPAMSSVDEYVKLIKDHSDARRLIMACNDVITEALEYDDTVDALLEKAETAIYAIRSKPDRYAATSIDSELAQSLQEARLRGETGSVVVGTPSGFTDLDFRLQGFKPQEMTVVAARPSVGKTAFTLAILHEVAVNYDEPVLLFSIEMSRRQVANRIVCAEAGLDSFLLRSGRLSEEQWQAADSVRGKLESTGNLFVSQNPLLTMRNVRSEIRRINTALSKRGKQLALVAVDHLGLMQSDGDRRGKSREREIAELSQGFKSVAREFDCSTLVLSQLNRQSENRSDHRPLLSDLRESGSIEQDADVVIMLYREDVYQNDPSLHTNIAEAIIAKNRDGPTGIVKLYFDKKSTRFKDLTSTSVTPPPSGLTDQSFLI